MVNAVVVGARGYLGRECVRFLSSHPDVEHVVPVSSSQEGQAYGASVPAFAALTDLQFVADDAPAVRDADVVFLATTSEDTLALGPGFVDGEHALVVDLSRAHRAEALAGDGPWTYGLSELAPGVPQGTRLVANPGCYPTAALLGLGPAVEAGLIDGDAPVIVDGKSGVSGAGATPREDLHFPEANEAVRAYKVLGHDHEAEMRAACGRWEPGRSTQRRLKFTPHLVPQNRGLLDTIYLHVPAGTTTDDARAVYEKAYAACPFVRVVEEANTAHVRGSNVCEIAVTVDPDAGLMVVRSAIDNLIKGGAGNAVQTMNLALGLGETAGLPTLGGAP